MTTKHSLEGEEETNLRPGSLVHSLFCSGGTIGLAMGYKSPAESYLNEGSSQMR